MSTHNDNPASQTPLGPTAQGAKIVLCPYCGSTQAQTHQCKKCGGLFEPLSRKATQIAMGPWYIRDKANPFRPGCSYDVVKRMVEAGRIKASTVVRGPSTKQFWSVARHVPGLAHLLGYCHGCGAHVDRTDVACPKCDVLFGPILERNELGLQYPTASAARKAQKELEAEQAGLATKTETGEPKSTSHTPPTEQATGSKSADTPAGATTPTAASADAQSSSGDLLEQVLGDLTPPNFEPGQRAAALDFAPGAEQVDDATGPLPSAGSGRWLNIVLLILNIIAAMVVGLLYMMHQGMIG